MKRYTEIKSRNSVTKIDGNKVQVKVPIPANTCHPGENIEFRSLAQPPTWNCAKCGKLLRAEAPVNRAVIFEP
jgi:hypothetical protein